MPSINWTVNRVTITGFGLAEFWSDLYDSDDDNFKPVGLKSIVTDEQIYLEYEYAQSVAFDYWQSIADQYEVKIINEYDGPDDESGCYIFEHKCETTWQGN